MRRIHLTIAMPLATARHCSNDCPFMNEELLAPGVVGFSCNLFREKLTWDPKRKTHGNLRLAACKKAEREDSGCT